MLDRVTNTRLLGLVAAALGLLIIGMCWSSTAVGLESWASVLQRMVPTTPEEALWGWFGPELPLRVKAFKALGGSVPDRAQFRVVISAEPDTPLPHGWRAGDNIRWVTLQRTTSGWVIADVALNPGA
jgi:hypothetical protein